MLYPSLKLIKTDSTIVNTTVAAVEIPKQTESNYKTIFTIAGAAADLSLAITTLLLINPIRINMGGGW